ncbi:MAG TPA: hypothetical protein ENN25_00625 [Euryarchaeota archaeon]|nr:hypothetical protein [Euryarchaeota archaeon]
MDRLPPDLQHVSPHSWLSEELKQSYEERIARKGFFELYVSKLAMQKMINHSKMLGREEREAMGFMLGDICRHESHGFVMVRDIVTGDLLSSCDSVRFDHGNLQGLFKELDASGFDYVIVGWYHSHPGFGCFMSKTDMKTQSTLFSERFHSAIVIDPVREEIMAFRLRGKRCAPLDFSVYWHELETPYRGKKIMRRSRVLRRDRR